MKKVLCFVLALLIFTGAWGMEVSAGGGSLDNFHERYEYSDGLFADISDGYWYGKYVAKVFALGLMDGRGDGFFAPNDPVTLAETGWLRK